MWWRCHEGEGGAQIRMVGRRWVGGWVKGGGGEAGAVGGGGERGREDREVGGKGRTRVWGELGRVVRGGGRGGARGERRVGEGGRAR